MKAPLRGITGIFAVLTIGGVLGILIDRALFQQQAVVDSAWLHVRSHLHSSVDSVRNAIERVLTPERRQGFDA